MKKILIVTLASIILLAVFTTPSYAIADTQVDAIQTLLDDACRISGVPGMSLSVLSGDEVYYISSGYANREKAISASEDTLYELASVSKAFTGAGILLLEEQGLLSMADSIQEYLPWFTLRYKGNAVNMESITLNNFLHHTSGLTNNNHIQDIPQGNSPDMLQKTVEMLVDVELDFFPGERYDYGTVNYDILGLIIEQVSGQSYEDFMDEQVFQALGLHQTYVYKEEAQATGQLAQGYRSSFFITSPYDTPDYRGNKPAGYIISCTKDMARWMGIQLGTIQDIPESFKAVIKKSHQGDTSVPDSAGMYYAGGWTVDVNVSVIEHAGVNPNYVTEVAILPNEQTAICLLSNGANTNIEIAKSVNEILKGNLSQSYGISTSHLIEITRSVVTIISCLLAILFFVLGLLRKKRGQRQAMEKKSLRITIAWSIITVFMCVLTWVFPSLIGFNWSTFLVWQTYSTLTIFISLALLSACITWFVYAKSWESKA